MFPEWGDVPAQVLITWGGVLVAAAMGRASGQETRALLLLIALLTVYPAVEATMIVLVWCLAIKILEAVRG